MIRIVCRSSTQTGTPSDALHDTSKGAKRYSAPVTATVTATPQSIVARALSDADREAISGWHYPEALAIYDPGPGAHELREPEHFALAWPDGELIGYATLGEQAQVPGGSYAADSGTTDLGMGLRPDLVGRGLGATALLAVIDEAVRRTPTARLRVTVAESNARATALVTHAGFQASHHFTRGRDGRGFIQYERDAVGGLHGGYGLARVEACDRAALVGLLDVYLDELSPYAGHDVGARIGSEYRYLDAYFSEPGRHAFLMRVGEEVAGFAMIRGPESTGEGWSVAEFFVGPQHRRSGLGRWAISSIWRRFGGSWSLEVHTANAGAVAFWTRCVRSVSTHEPDVVPFEAQDGPRLRFAFDVGAPSRQSGGGATGGSA